MTKLIITPIDMAARGSFAERKAMLRAAAGLEHTRGAGGIAQIAAAFDAIEELVRGHLETDDGTTVDEALAMCSADEFDALFSGLIGKETVPNPSGAS